MSFGDARVITRGALETPVKLGATSAGYSNTTDRWLGVDTLGRIDKHMGYPNGESGFFFKYDSLGRLRQSQTAQRTPGGLPGGCPSTNYGLDDPACPATSAYTLGGGPTYTYDAVGNRTDLSGTYTTGNRITGFNSCTYTTDADGNVKTKTGGSCAGTASFFWTAEGQLDSVHVTATGTGYRYLYDAAGRVVLRRKNGSADGYFLWQGDNLLAELNGSATGKIAEYSWYPGLDNLHAVIVGTERRYGHVDGLGNVIALTNESKVLKATYSYGDWGAHAGTADSNRARFKGAMWMGPDLDLYYMRNRWYEPATGRFLSEDLIGLVGGINPSIFVNADPVNGRDPSGLVGLPQCRDGYALYGMFETNPDGSRGALIGQPYCKFLGGSGTPLSDRGGTPVGAPPSGPSCSALLMTLGSDLVLDLTGLGLARRLKQAGLVAENLLKPSVPLVNFAKGTITDVALPGNAGAYLNAISSVNRGETALMGIGAAWSAKGASLGLNGMDAAKIGVGVLSGLAGPAAPAVQTVADFAINGYAVFRGCF